MKFKPLLLVIILAIIGFCVHEILFHFFVPKLYQDNFIYSVPSLYIGFGITSLAIVFVLIQIEKRNIDNVGYTFLLLTSVKMVPAYVLLRPIIETTLPKTQTEKMSFFIIFIFFLAIETIATIRILNNKQ